MELQNYERLIQQKMTGRALLLPLLLIFSYLVWGSVWLGIFLLVYCSPALVVLAISLTALLIFLTWKYTQVEYEYSIYCGSFFLAKIYGKKTRKELLEIDLKRALLIAPHTEESLQKANDFKSEKTLWAVSSPQAENVWLLVYTDGDKNASTLFFEADERMLRTLRRENPRAMAKISKSLGETK